jgi:hypothetical protein
MMMCKPGCPKKIAERWHVALRQAQILHLSTKFDKFITKALLYSALTSASLCVKKYAHTVPSLLIMYDVNKCK